MRRPSYAGPAIGCTLIAVSLWFADGGLRMVLAAVGLAFNITYMVRWVRYRRAAADTTVYLVITASARYRVLGRLSAEIVADTLRRNGEQTQILRAP